MCRNSAFPYERGKNKIQYFLGFNSGIVQQSENNCLLWLGPLVTVRGPTSTNYLPHMC